MKNLIYFLPLNSIKKNMQKNYTSYLKEYNNLPQYNYEYIQKTK